MKLSKGGCIIYYCLNEAILVVCSVSIVTLVGSQSCTLSLLRLDTEFDYDEKSLSVIGFDKLLA